MDIPNTIPTLAKLMAGDEICSNFCLWYSKTRDKKNTHQKCTNMIAKADAEERRESIKRLRVLIDSVTNKLDASVITATSSITSEICRTLKQIAKLLLCKRRHREKSEAVFEKWSKEFGILKQEPDQALTEKIRKALNVEGFVRLSCVGEKRDNGKCTNWISTKNRDRAKEVIAAVAEAQGSSPLTENLVQELAHLLLCQRNHQDQADEKAEEWIKMIKTVFQPADVAPKPPSTPSISERTANIESETPESKMSSIWSKVDSVTPTTPVTSPINRRRCSLTTTPSDSPLLSKSTRTSNTTIGNEASRTAHPRVAHPRVTRKTTSEYRAGFLPPEPMTPVFEAFSPKKGSAFLKNIYNKITKTLTPEGKMSGYLYGFQRDGDDYIKIGYTTRRVQNRLEEWNKQCNQKVKLVLAEHLPNVGRVELLVHATLHQERRREMLVNGRCNGGKGCAKKHDEWFDASRELVEDVVGILKLWILSMPYDKEGKLKPIWRYHIGGLRAVKTGFIPGCWRDWVDVAVLPPSLGSATICEVKDEKAATADDIEEKKPRATTIAEVGIKEEPNSDDAVDAHDMRRDLRRLSRGFAASIAALKQESSLQRPLEDLPLHLPNPPIISPVAG